MRVSFTKDFDYKPTPRCTIAYKAGMEMTVKRDCGLLAIAAEKAVEVPAKSREDENGQA